MILALALLIWRDLRDRRLPNYLVGIVVCLYFVQAALHRTSLANIGSHLLICSLAFSLAAAMFRFGWMGGGDVKLAAAVFLWAGLHLGWTVYCVVSLTGLALAVLMLALDRLANTAQRAKYGVLHALAVGRGVPYGVALACGGAWAVWVPNY